MDGSILVCAKLTANAPLTAAASNLDLISAGSPGVFLAQSNVLGTLLAALVARPLSACGVNLSVGKPRDFKSATPDVINPC